MNYSFFNYISKKTGMSLQEFEDQVRPHFSTVKYQKKDFIVRMGDVCKFIMFIEKGLTSTYTVNGSDQKFIHTFGFENYWVTNRESYSLEIPSKKYIQALELTEGVRFEKEDFERLLKNNIRIRNMITDLKERNAIFCYQKIASLKHDSAEKKYHNFLKEFPEITQRIPQHMIASYLGLKPETLSRLRKNPVRK